MKRIIGYVLFNLCLTYNMQAQSLLPAKKDINPSKEFSRIEMPGLKMGVYSFQNKEINLAQQKHFENFMKKVNTQFLNRMKHYLI